MPDLVPIRRALLSVSDKTDLVPLARALAAAGAELISTGGTAKTLAGAGLPVTPIDKVTGFPEMMGGRVKTLHPKVHGGLLGLRDDAEHAAAMKTHGIEPIDLVCINLYPFERTVAAGADRNEAVEQIDIGGPSMIRSGAKNHEWVTVVTSPGQYDRVAAELHENKVDGKGATARRLRAQLAAAAFARTSEYDAAIAAYLGKSSGDSAFPPVLKLGYVKMDALRYGENPHQEAALYRDPASSGPTIVAAEKLHGKALSYNNVADAAAALEIAKALSRLDPSRVGAAVIKHLNPCGAALAADVTGAVDGALVGDPLAAYGGILAVNRALDAGAAERLCAGDLFLEVVVAPAFEPAALERLKSRWVNVRLLAVGERPASVRRKMEYRSIPGGMLVQDRDTGGADPSGWKHSAGPVPTARHMADAAFVETIARFLSSNAIAIGGPDPQRPGATRLYGAGAGQMDRVASCRIAVAKAGELCRGAVAAGDAFFPFPDGPGALIDAGVKVIVHPGGSKRDAETFDLCNRAGVTCLVTGVRHFRH
ncbi:MAG: bifunctional phosphoribosylaminoimidazolecarboxamide formyltransferase/IMP cyclohydrolase [Phycisphaerales bacterium]|nr:bifunctional phosphoribosylaminoimidazolecarboxamide formyltransferase/IMP cyclohydrolase [Phycisphaerales bacterium]